MKRPKRVWMLTAYVVWTGVAASAAGAWASLVLPGPRLLSWALVALALDIAAALGADNFIDFLAKKKEPAIPAPDGYHFGEDHEWGPEDQTRLIAWIRMLRQKLKVSGGNDV